jgi:IS5 family transposase
LRGGRAGAPEVGNGRPPIALERILRMRLLAHLFNLAHAAMEEVIYEPESMRRLVDTDLGWDRLADETTAYKFRRLLERSHLGPWGIRGSRITSGPKA